MAAFSQIPRGEKHRIASELHDKLLNRAQASAPEPLLDGMIPKLGACRDALALQVSGKAGAEASRSALLAKCDVDDDDVDRWYRHIYRYNEVESLRRNAPEHTAIHALLSAAYPDGLEHVDARIPDQNEEVKKTLVAYRDPKYASALAAMEFPGAWLDRLDAAVKQSDASFSAYQASFSDASTAVALGRDAEVDWVNLMRGLDHAIALRSIGADASVVEEGRGLIAPLKDALRLLRSESKARATKRGNNKTDDSPQGESGAKVEKP